ncbi:kinetoplast-associated protein kap [Colletotrichum karsti]|uniref:Kinetoplast-associated protein kap n=1 Tax=Colletotrichum karsti TaxID=1095194 RepID=A0A9P6IDA8_9PEZI|nr:kinetoplast-associated protein kap [Colletotrichum karsti]KAF9881307.1 kinetoplast-associated protein kap [Colletotrichum karsti]
MAPSLVRPQGHLSPAEALELAQQAPTILRNNPKAFSSSPLVSLFSASETPETWIIYENLLLACLRTGDSQAAHQCLERLVIRFGDDNERIMAFKGLVKEAEADNDGELVQVLKEYETILGQNATNIPVAKRRIALLKSTGKISDAITALNSLVDFSPTDAEAWAELADLYLSQGLYSQSIFALEEVLVLTPNAWNIHARMGEVLYMAASASDSTSQQQLAESVKRFARSIELCDDYLRGYYGLKLVTNKLLNEPSKPSRQTGSDDWALPKTSTLQKLNEVATQKLAEIVRRNGAQDKLWQGYDESEVAAARDLLSKESVDLNESYSDDYDDGEDLGPEDSASVSPHRSYRPQAPRAASRYHQLPHRPAQPAYPPAFRPGSVPNPPESVDPDEYQPSYGHRGGYGGHAPPNPHAGQQVQGPGGHNPYFGGRGHAPNAYPQSHVGGYPMGGSPYGPPPNQHSMVPYGYQPQPPGHNPFSPMSNGGGQSYFGDGRGNQYDAMMPYQQPQAPAYYGPGGYQMPQHMAQFLYSQPAPPPPPTEVAPPKTPAPAAPPSPPKPDPEKIKLQEQLEAFKAEQARKEEAERRRELEEKIRKDTEDAIARRMEEMRKAQEEAKREIERAKKEAEQAAREAIELERKAEEEREKRHKEAMARAEREAREKYEAEMRAQAAAKAAEAKARAEAEAAAQLKLELAIKAQEDARIAAEKKAAEDAAAKAKYEADMKAQAEKEARDKIAAEKKAAEEAAAAKAKYEAEMKEKAEKEARDKIEAEKKAAADAAAAKTKYETEMKEKAEKEARDKLEAEAKAKAEAEAAAAAAKKAEDELKKKAAEDAKAKYEAETKKVKDKLPIKFKDAVGRKFSFPFHICATWGGMEELIKQAFLHVDVIGPHVQEGHYDLIGPNGEIILPQIWEKVVEPDWTIEMKMWPMENKPPPPAAPGMFPPGMRPHGPIPPGQARQGRPPSMGIPPNVRPGGPMPPPPGPPGWPGRGGGPPPPRVRPDGLPHGVNIVNAAPPEKKPKPRGSMLSWMAGGKPPPKKK